MPYWTPSDTVDGLKINRINPNNHVSDEHWKFDALTNNHVVIELRNGEYKRVGPSREAFRINAAKSKKINVERGKIN